ncbi:MAG: glucose 1-dehydrogenase [Chloroflexi bacterium]|jgi:meso-butanediol dehydrogenase/(S,S)-butanediol dehydrogenase/diacetyl reductase|nr:glucose 1-dehydrogenase [Chloroflexota bacterium]
MGKLSGKVAIVTGATSGIGRATALLFAEEGADVVLTGRRAELGKTVEAECRRRDGRALFVQADHTCSEDCARVVESALQAFGQINILFNNAGIVTKGTAESTSEEDWAQTMALNVTAVWRMCKLVIPEMRKVGKGVIVNNASDWAVVGGKGALPYATSKGAVALMTKSMALDHAAENIRVNAVCPGDTFVDRWLERGYFEHSSPVTLEEALKEAAAYLPMQRFGLPEEIARAVLFLASDDSSFVTGHLLLVDGGNTAQ